MNESADLREAYKRLAKTHADNSLYKFNDWFVQQLSVITVKPLTPSE